MKRNRSGEDVLLRTKRLPSGAAVMQASVTNALTRSLFIEWAIHGYAALSLERVAKRARVGKAALYRRWPSKAVMVADCMSRVGLKITAVPNTGSLHGDVRATLLSLRRLLMRSITRRVLLDLHAEMGRSTELEALIRPFQDARRYQVDAMLDRAMERGEVPTTLDRTLAADFLGAAIYWRVAILDGKADSLVIERLTAMLCNALATPLNGCEGTS
jgi:AcrR family transcriptional regulator